MTIFYKTVDDHIIHVDEILTNLTEAGVTLKKNKCHFLQRQVKYLGHMVKPRCSVIGKKNVMSQRDAQSSTNETQPRSFIGLCNIHRRYIKDPTGLANMLNKVLKKGAPDSFTFYVEQMKSINILIDKKS